ncbi:helix-turn-helix domain-containing protein [Listeria grandensis]|uniref:helix-turn-helix domain-containing protein n=1 Tax=Listeria grandensis TaxID=1494963 RepID=UPI0026950EBB
MIYLSKEIRIHLNDILDKYDISLNKLARESNIEPARLWELANYKRQTINIGYLVRIAETLEISDIRELITLEESES